jgi:hypothetical protein
MPSCCATVRSIALEIVQTVRLSDHDAHLPSFAHSALQSFALWAVCVLVSEEGWHSLAQEPVGVQVLAIPRSENVGELSMKSSATG